MKPKLTPSFFSHSEGHNLHSCGKAEKKSTKTVEKFSVSAKRTTFATRKTEIDFLDLKY